MPKTVTVAGELTPPLRELGEALVADAWRNVELLLEDEVTDESQRVLVRWSAYLGVLALDVFDAIVVLLREDKLRAAYMMARTLIDLHVRLRYYIVQSRTVGGATADMHAARDWSVTGRDLTGEIDPYEPDEWDDAAQQRIVDVLGADEMPRKRAFLEMCEFLEHQEEKENEYRWARAAWLMEGALVRGDRALAGDVVGTGAKVTVHRTSPTATARSIFFEAVWYVLDIMDSFGMVRGWAFGAVKARQDAIRLYLATKPEEKT
jgi:hypothetical protein